METRLLKSRKMLEDFLKRWPLDVVKSMTLSQYVDTDNQDTFCQWIETRTRDLGSIKGLTSVKFGIYKRKDKNKNPKKYKNDHDYSWLAYYGETRKEAFKSVKQDVLDTIKAASTGDFQAIDNLHLPSLFKWKIAFLYSNERLIPIFKKELLWQIAEHQGLSDARKKPISKIQALLYRNKPADMNIYKYAEDLYHQFSLTINKEVAYYVIGSKYGARKDILPLMKEYNVVSTDYSGSSDLSFLHLATPEEISNKLKQKGESSASRSTLSHFLQLKPGDIVAIKSSGSPKAGKAFLGIVAHAVVVEREGVVYWHEPKELGHCINVEFIKTDFHKQLSLGGFGKTIHRIEKEEWIKTIFGNFKSADSKSVRRGITTRRRKRRRSASKSKNVSVQNRKGSGAYVTNPKHNLIQQLFKEHLEAEYGKENVLIEENNVDVKLLQPERITFYEVKPYDLAEDCIREGLGQILSYVFFDKDKRDKEIVIVGPYPPSKEEQGLIEFLKKKLEINFDYEHFKID